MAIHLAVTFDCTYSRGCVPERTASAELYGEKADSSACTANRCRRTIRSPRAIQRSHLAVSVGGLNQRSNMESAEQSPRDRRGYHRPILQRYMQPEFDLVSRRFKGFSLRMQFVSLSLSNTTNRTHLKNRHTQTEKWQTEWRFRTDWNSLPNRQGS